MLENESNRVEFGTRVPENVPVRVDNDELSPDELTSDVTKVKAVMSPTEIRDGLVVVKFFKDTEAMDAEEYSVNIHRLLKFWRRLMKLRK